MFFYERSKSVITNYGIIILKTLANIKYHIPLFNYHFLQCLELSNSYFWNIYLKNKTKYIGTLRKTDIYNLIYQPYWLRNLKDYDNII